MLKRSLLIFSLLSLIFSQNVEVSGNIQYTENFGDKIDHNTNTRGDNPFNRMRAKLFFFSVLTDKIEIDVETVFDDQADPTRWFWLHGASVKISEIFDNSYFNLKIGKIPMNIGNFINRVNEAENPVIGLPLMYHYRTNVDWYQAWDPNSQFVLRLKRDNEAFLSRNDFPTASPTAYEAVWDIGVEIFGNIDNFFYSFAITNGSLSNPDKKAGEDKQFSARLSYRFTDWLSLGISGARNRFLNNRENLLANQSLKDFYQHLYGVDLNLEWPTFKFFFEYFDSSWDANIPEKELTNTMFFGELNYLLPFSSNLELVGRYDQMNFNLITVNDILGERKIWWDSDVKRYEFGLRYIFNRSLILKTVYQHWDFQFYSSVASSSLQILVKF
jgi:hypothetical protein